MKIGALIPIRLDSERLPGKALKLLQGRPVVHHLLDRVLHSQHITSKKNAVVCTTCEKTDDPLIKSIQDYGASIYRGNKNDLIQRFKDANDHFKFDIILQIDGDDPLVDPDYMDLTIDALLKNPTLDAAVTVGIPSGTNVKSFTKVALEKVYSRYKSENNDTGFALYFIKSNLCKCLEIEPSNNDHILNEARLTLDYKEDLLVFENIFKALYKTNKIFHLQEVITFLKQNPHIMKINNSLQETYMNRTRQKLDIDYKDEDGTIQKIEL